MVVARRQWLGCPSCGADWQSGRLGPSSALARPARASSGAPARCTDVGVLLGDLLTVGCCSEHGPICHLFELILVIHATTSNGTNHIV
jgi:hypothetical protein